MNSREALDLLQHCLQEGEYSLDAVDALNVLEACVEALAALLGGVRGLMHAGICPTPELNQARAALKGDLCQKH